MGSFKHNTRQLVTLAKDGDEDALNQLCRVYADRVRWMVRLRLSRELRPKLESMDLAQDVLMRALRGLGDFTYTNEGDLIRWLSRITQNVLRDNVDRLHAGKRDIRKEIPIRDHGQTTGGRRFGVAERLASTTPSVIMSKREDLSKLEKAIDALKPEYRDVIIQTKIEGLSYGEIGSRLNKSADAVRMLVSSALAELTSVFMRI
ncbi:MAG: sigma-70 family RNA polymerase sigma factor [Planctomycetes bacterium]|nr:sigma-70 family RNA polymerase sigma factor [Planctomycetota bacterium]